MESEDTSMVFQNAIAKDSEKEKVFNDIFKNIDKNLAGGLPIEKVSMGQSIKQATIDASRKVAINRFNLRKNGQGSMKFRKIQRKRAATLVTAKNAYRQFRKLIQNVNRRPDSEAATDNLLEFKKKHAELLSDFDKLSQFQQPIPWTPFSGNIGTRDKPIKSNIRLIDTSSVFKVKDGVFTMVDNSDTFDAFLCAKLLAGKLDEISIRIFLTETMVTQAEIYIDSVSVKNLSTVPPVTFMGVDSRYLPFIMNHILKTGDGQAQIVTKFDKKFPVTNGNVIKSFGKIAGVQGNSTVAEMELILDTDDLTVDAATLANSVLDAVRRYGVQRDVLEKLPEINAVPRIYNAAGRLVTRPNNSHEKPGIMINVKPSNEGCTMICVQETDTESESVTSILLEIEMYGETIMDDYLLTCRVLGTLAARNVDTKATEIRQESLAGLMFAMYAFDPEKFYRDLFGTMRRLLAGDMTAEIYDILVKFSIWMKVNNQLNIQYGKYVRGVFKLGRYLLAQAQSAQLDNDILEKLATQLAKLHGIHSIISDIEAELTKPTDGIKWLEVIPGEVKTLLEKAFPGSHFVFEAQWQRARDLHKKFIPSIYGPRLESDDIIEFCKTLYDVLVVSLSDIGKTNVNFKHVDEKVMIDLLPRLGVSGFKKPHFFVTEDFKMAYSRALLNSRTEILDLVRDIQENMNAYVPDISSNLVLIEEMISAAQARLSDAVSDSAYYDKSNPRWEQLQLIVNNSGLAISEASLKREQLKNAEKNVRAELLNRFNKVKSLVSDGELSMEDQRKITALISPNGLRGVIENIFRAQLGTGYKLDNKILQRGLEHFNKKIASKLIDADDLMAAVESVPAGVKSMIAEVVRASGRNAIIDIEGEVEMELEDMVEEKKDSEKPRKRPLKSLGGKKKRDLLSNEFDDIVDNTRRLNKPGMSTRSQSRAQK